ncbi:hypothetical protein [Flavobacterium sp.]|uniref:hypothetical protein n=1 Tax=Flavobacterium sp. TaxID=239 RepID=UPI00374CEAFF
MDKLTKTIFLLILIAISMQTYFINGEKNSESVIIFAVPISINILLIIIYFSNKEDFAYRKSVGNLINWCLIISAIYFVIFGYLLQLGKAFKN